MIFAAKEEDINCNKLKDVQQTNLLGPRSRLMCMQVRVNIDREAVRIRHNQKYFNTWLLRFIYFNYIISIIIAKRDYQGRVSLVHRSRFDLLLSIVYLG